MLKKNKSTGEDLLNLQSQTNSCAHILELEEQLVVTNTTVADLKRRISSLVDEIVVLQTDLRNTQDDFSKHLMTLAKKVEPTHKW